MIRRQRKAQSTVETMLAISVITIGVCAAAYAFIGPLAAGVTALDQDARIVMDDARPAAASGKR